MTILALLNRVNSKFIHPPHPFMTSQADLRKSYLLGVAMQARSDAHLDAQEKALFLEMSRAFNVDEDTALDILESAIRPDEAAVKTLRQHLIDSKYKYYFILDLQIMAHQDLKVKEVETKVIDEFGTLLQVEKEDVVFLTGLADALVQGDRKAKDAWVDEFFHTMEIKTQAQPDDFKHYTDDSNFHDH